MQSVTHAKDLSASRAGHKRRRYAGFIVKRVFGALGLLIVVSVLIFLGLEALPSDAAQAILGKSANEANLAKLRAELGLDQPLWQRYVHWIGNVFQGDLGVSYSNRRAVADTLLPRLSMSLTLAALAALITIPVSVGLGAYAARHNGGFIDRGITVLSRVTVSAPEFFTGYALIFVFALWLGWLPSSSPIRLGMGFGDLLYAFILPISVLFLAVAGHVIVTTRAALLDVLSRPYIEMARLKGVSEGRILLTHALPNAIGPIANVALMNIAYMVTGIVVVEAIFVLPGLGQYLVDSVTRRDMPVVQACSLIFAAIYIFLNMAADLITIFATPRLRSRL